MDRAFIYIAHHDFRAFHRRRSKSSTLERHSWTIGT